MAAARGKQWYINKAVELLDQAEAAEVLTLRYFLMELADRYLTLAGMGA